MKLIIQRMFCYCRNYGRYLHRKTYISVINKTAKKLYCNYARLHKCRHAVTLMSVRIYHLDFALCLFIFELIMFLFYLHFVLLPFVLCLGALACVPLHLPEEIIHHIIIFFLNK